MMEVTKKISRETAHIMMEMMMDILVFAYCQNVEEGKESITQIMDNAQNYARETFCKFCEVENIKDIYY